ncbi:ABC transporter permease [Teredinibacter turnerae]|uniref:ABC-2 type transporter n=1 Tax=Teredinibacter turnerae (strain ATCC 39867 / T7901) TaxID=377629 RepID=C5BIM6_TERTT|nr:ABC transporter permease [Teredinibacter turnerae]ACR14633.1 ABC-2 type transporter [Teredinibacter turnerae T7901]
MMKTWIFFKLRMLQLKYDKTALFFCYVFPVILLLGIGYPLQLQSDPKIEVYYQDFAANEESKATIALLDAQKLLELKPYEESIPAYEAVADNDVKRVLTILAQDKQPDLTAYGVDLEPAQVANEKLSTISLHLIKNDIDENRIENAALASAIDQLVSGDTEIELDQYTLKSDRLTSYLVTLLPGLIGLTLMIIGFNGFGSVLIEEEHHGLFKNIKTIDVSPVPFLAGLFLSRLLVSHSVAIGLCLVAMLVFGIKFDFNIPMFFLVVTLGSIAFLGIGLFIATVSPSTTAFNGIVNFVQMPFIVLGGVFFSVSLFPDWLQYIALAIPLTQLNVAMQKVLFEPNDMSVISSMSLELVVLFSWCIVSVVISKMKFKW